MAGLPGHKHWLDTICSKKSTWTSGIACNIEESRPNASILESDGDACNADRGIYNNYVFNKLTHIQVCLVAAFWHARISTHCNPTNSMPRAL